MRSLVEGRGDVEVKAFLKPNNGEVKVGSSPWFKASHGVPEYIYGVGCEAPSSVKVDKPVAD